MREFSTTVEINAPPARVWAVVSDIERWHEWTASVSSVQKLDTGPLGVGSKARVRQPRLLPAVFDVTRWEPQRGFDWVTRSGGVTAVARHMLEPTAAGTRVRLSVEFTGVLSPLIAWFTGSLTNRYLQMEAAGLKRRAEEG